MVGFGQHPGTTDIGLFPSAPFRGNVLVTLSMFCVRPELGIPANGTGSVSDFKLSWFEVPSVVISSSAMCVNQTLISWDTSIQLAKKEDIQSNSAWSLTTVLSSTSDLWPAVNITNTVTSYFELVILLNFSTPSLLETSYKH